MLPSALFDESAREALRQATAALDRAEADGQAPAISRALAQMAACYRGLRALAGAESCYEAALRWARGCGGTDQIVDLLCALSETAAALAEGQHPDEPAGSRAARERARDHAFEAATLAGRVADPGWEATVLLRLSDVLDRCGDRDDAVQLQARALRLMSDGPRAGAPDSRRLPDPERSADS